MLAQAMRIHDPDGYETRVEVEVLGEVLPLQGRLVIELGCGRAQLTRMLAEQFGVARLVATEVDRVQLEENLRISDLPRVEFISGGAQDIPAGDGEFDIVLMFKSLHHVPLALMGRALEEIRRVLRPGGLAYISEPVYAGAFNDLLRLFHDEKRVREAAFEAVRQSVAAGRLELVRQIFFAAPAHYESFAAFEDRMIRVTHTEHRIDDGLYRRIREGFQSHMTPDGAHFLNPTRVDLLRRPAAG